LGLCRGESAGSRSRIVWRDSGVMLNDKITKGYEISSLGGCGFNNLSTRAVESVGTAWPSGPGVKSRKLFCPLKTCIPFYCFLM
jgi:hypothetical protein